MRSSKPIAHFHLPGLFEFHEFYSRFLPLFYGCRNWFYDWCDIGSIYGAPANCLWGGGRVGAGECNPDAILNLLQKYGISARLTFSNSLLKEEHLTDIKCNMLCEVFNQVASPQNGVIVHSDLLLDYLRAKYAKLYFVSSTTKVLTDFKEFENELKREEFRFVVPDFRLNKNLVKLNELSQPEKKKVEFLCNECCSVDCQARRQCYEAVSYKNLGENVADFHCMKQNDGQGYRFSKAMANPSFISIADIQDIYLPQGFSNFKIEGRGLGNALLLEFILYYMTRPESQIQLREAMYLDDTLDLF